jgi:TetR/AcrR family transcriptional regulator
MAAPRSSSKSGEARGEVRDEILDHAARLFARRGFDGTAIQDIADAVGIKKPSLLYHFPSKDDLRRAVLGELLSRWNDVLPRLLFAATSGEGRFDAVLGEMVNFFTDEPDRARLLVREVLDRPDEMGELVALHVPKWVAMVCGYIRKGQQEGTIFAEVDPEAYVVQVINLVVSGVAVWGTLSAVASERKLREHAARLPARHIAEIVRVAKSSLFVPAAAPPPTVAKSPNRPKRPARSAGGQHGGKAAPRRKLP